MADKVGSAAAHVVHRKPSSGITFRALNPVAPVDIFLTDGEDQPHVELNHEVLCLFRINEALLHCGRGLKIQLLCNFLSTHYML